MMNIFEILQGLQSLYATIWPFSNSDNCLQAISKGLITN